MHLLFRLPGDFCIWIIYPNASSSTLHNQNISTDSRVVTSQHGYTTEVRVSTARVQFKPTALHGTLSGLISLGANNLAGLATVFSEHRPTL